MPKLLIKFPTRNRPAKFMAVFSKYASLLSGKHATEFVVSLDEDDAAMNNPGMQAWLAAQAECLNLRWHYGQSRTKIEAVNADLNGADGDVLLLASDDMVPVLPNYDAVIFDAFAQMFPDFDGAVKFWDGYRPKHDSLMTLAVLGFPLYRRFGYIYHPAYRSLFADQEQTFVYSQLGRLARCDLCIIRHEWTPVPFDALHARNESPSMYAADGATYSEREARNFDLGSPATIDVRESGQQT